MKFLKILEWLDSISLKKWNETQRNIWIILSSRDLVRQNDADMFHKFGEFFDKFYKMNNRAPSVYETIKYMGLKKNESVSKV